MTISMKIDIKDKISVDINKKISQLRQVPNRAFNFFVRQTPIRTGNARNHTRLNRDTIIANYPYAQRLDTGYSRQAPDGMSRPTEVYVQKIVDQIIKRR